MSTLPPSTSPLVALNTHVVGYVGLGSGAAVLVQLAAFFHYLEDANNLMGLAHEIHQHTFGAASAGILGRFIGIVGALVVALVASWLGRPPTIASSPAK